MSVQFRELRGDLVVAVPVAGAAGGTDDEFELFVAPFGLTIVRARWVPAAAVVADAGNNFTLTVRNRGSDASGTALPASRSYAATNSIAHVAEDMTLSSTAADLTVAAGDALTAEKIEAGTGLAMPDGLLQLHYRITG